MSRRTIALLVVGCLVVGTVAALGRDLVRDLVAGALVEPAAPARPLSTAEAHRLASMRQHNWDDARVGVRAAIGHPADRLYAVGWVDWRRPMVYLALSGDQPGTVTELVQAVPDLVASRPGPEQPAGPTPAAIDPYPPPPVEPPRDGWRVRRPGAAGPAGAPAAPGTVDTLVALLFTIGAGGPEQTGDVGGAADQLARSESRWLRQDRTAGYEVDVLLGPALPPTDGPARPAEPDEPDGHVPDRSLADMGGAVQYWLDGDARLHRLEALLAADTPVRVDVDRADRTEPVVLDLLGGAAVDPRPVTDDELETLTQLRRRNLAAGGGELTVAVPDEQAGPVRAVGWLDWQRPVAYLARSAEGATDRLLWADRTGIASLPDPPAADAPPLPLLLPPLPAPAGAGWQWSAWEERGDELDRTGEVGGGFDLDLLLNEALALSGWEVSDPDRLRASAAWLRADQVAGTPVAVFELPREFEAQLAPGEARMRYWVDGSGVLRRLEIRTGTGGFGQLDLTPGPVPELGYLR